MKTHTLKTHSPYFGLVWDGIKTFEVRKNDRDYQVGDRLKLVEVDPITLKPTGNFATVAVTYILQGGSFGIEPGYVVMGIDH